MQVLIVSIGESAAAGLCEPPFAYEVSLGAETCSKATTESVAQWLISSTSV